MIVQILDKRWKLRFVKGLGDDVGQCDGPHVPNKEIRILSKLRGMDKLDTIIHECLHAAGWHITEEFVNQFATDVARTLWRLGYRHPDERTDGQQS